MASDYKSRPTPATGYRDQVAEYEAGQHPPRHRAAGHHPHDQDRQGPQDPVDAGRGRYALVASLGGTPEERLVPQDLKADPKATIQDGPAPFDVDVREITGPERKSGGPGGLPRVSGVPGQDRAADPRLPGDPPLTVCEALSLGPPPSAATARPTGSGQMAGFPEHSGARSRPWKVGFSGCIPRPP